MAQSVITRTVEMQSNENSISTKEFLDFEKTCEAYKDSDEEIKLLFTEISRLSGENTPNVDTNVIGEDADDVDLILKKAEDLAQETETLLKCSPITDVEEKVEVTKIPEIMVTKPEKEVPVETKSPPKVNHTLRYISKDTNEVRRKPKTRPFSAGVADSKKRESTKITKPITNSPKKSNTCKHEPLLEELKNTNERVKSLELLNVQLNDDNKALRKKLDQINQEKHIVDLKLAESEKFIHRLGRQYENRNSEFKEVKENESRLIAELNKERNERKNLSIQHEKDIVTIHDLQRQVKEMEMILKRKHPDSVSALIVASKSSTVEDNKKKLLEDRISRLQQELKDKEDHFQGILLTLQEKFTNMKQKYESFIIDVERQLMDERKVNNELKNRVNKSNLVTTAVQTLPKQLHTISTQTFIKPDRVSSACSARMSQNSALFLNKLKEDSYLVATIKGLQTELTMKQRTIAKINRETEELKKNLRNLQKEKEVLLNLNPHRRSGAKSAKSTENILAKMNCEKDAELEEARKQRETMTLERNSLLDSLKRTNEEFILLKKKRIQDLHTLQVAHEKELMQMNMQLYPLQEEIKLLNRTVEILQDRVRVADEKLMRYHVDAHAGGDNNASRTSLRSKEAR